MPNFAFSPRVAPKYDEAPPAADEAKGGVVLDPGVTWGGKDVNNVKDRDVQINRVNSQFNQEDT